MRRFWAILAFIGFFLSLIIHLGAYIGFNTFEEIPLVMLIHIIALGFFIFVATKLKGQRSWNIIVQDIPKWGRNILLITAIFVFFNFAIFIAFELGKPVPQRISGEWYVYRIENNLRVFADTSEGIQDLPLVELEAVPVERHPDFFYEVSADYYYQRTLSQVRGFTGHWMLGFLLPAMYLWFKENEESIESHSG